VQEVKNKSSQWVNILTPVIITNVKSVWRDYPSIRASQSTLVNTQRGVTPLSATLMAVTELSDPYSCTYSYGRICHNISHITIIANTLATPEATNTLELVL